ncbi:MAG TPA: diguanylate cyclase [Rectinemataceae bacterium]|nr:diguanylate cyclase [Rectinemataceae bacterium]
MKAPERRSDEDPIQAEAEKILEARKLGADELWSAYERIAHGYAHLSRTFMKTVRISDQYQMRLRELNAALADASRVDYLTGLLNRRAFFEGIEPERSRARRHGRTLCVLMADIDDFKLVNDSHGHDAGDLALKGVARLLDAVLRKEDMKVRWGGEEFLAILPETGIGGGAATAEKLRALVEANAFPTHGAPIRLSISVGIALDDGGDIDAVISRADQALLEAKRAGKNRVMVSSAASSQP